MNFLGLFQDLTVGDLWPRSRNLVHFTKSAKVTDVLKVKEDYQHSELKIFKVLESEGILSAPVLDEGKFVGFIDMADIVLFVIGLFPKDIDLTTLSETDFTEVVLSGHRFTQAIASDVMGKKNFKANDLFYRVCKRNTPRF